MLDEHWNGGVLATADALYQINKNIIILDWRYRRSNSFSYDSVEASFPSVSRFASKGFRVWPASWTDVGATADLVWTENAERSRSGLVWGHLFTTWPFKGENVELDLPRALSPDAGHMPDGAVPGVARCIQAAVPEIDKKDCRHTASSCGTFPNCIDCTTSNGLVGGDYRDFGCVDGSCTYRAIDKRSLEAAATSYWPFSADAKDIVGGSNGTLMGGAKIGPDSERGKALILGDSGGYVSVPDAQRLKMTGALSISLWFRPDREVQARAALVSKGYTEYEVLVYPNAKVSSFTSDGTDTGFEQETWDGLTPASISNWQVGRWYHVVWTLGGQRQRLYLDGALLSEARKAYPGTMAGIDELDFGRRPNGGGGLPFSGAISDVMLFGAELDAQQSRALYYLYAKH
jgi:hypothetical protein